MLLGACICVVFIRACVDDQLGGFDDNFILQSAASM